MSRKRSKISLVEVKQEVQDVDVKQEVQDVDVKQEAEDDNQDNRLISLFPKVFECLIQSNELNSQYVDATAYKNHPAAFVTDKVWKFPLGLRLVCSDWNNAIEKYYESTHYPLINKSRVIQIHGTDTTQVDSYIKFLCKFGHQVESLNIEVLNFHDNTMVGLYLIIQQLVKNLQLLKSLWISYETPIQNYFEQLEETINLYPCPTFQKLNSLHVTGWISNQIVNEFLKKCNNLTSFKQSRTGSHFVGLNYKANFSTLRELSIRIETNSDFQQLKKFGKTWKLKKFVGNFLGLLDKENWVDIFQLCADNWSDTLENLGIMLPDMRHRNGYLEDMLNYTLHNKLEIPNLKGIMIWTAIPISLDFLMLTNVSLESIYITWIARPKELDTPTELYYEAMDQQYLEHLGSESEMAKSNIWRLFPKLQLVKSVGDVVIRPAKYGLPLK